MPNTTNIFVLGNGESRQGIKLEDLSSHGLIYGCNALYREFAPDMLISVDPAMHNEILATDYIENNKVCFREMNHAPNERFTMVNGRLVKDLPVPWDHPNVTKVQDIIASDTRRRDQHFVVKAGQDVLKNGFSSGPQAANMACCLEKPSDVYLIGHDLLDNNTDKINNIYKDTLNYSPSTAAPTPVGNWIEHLKLVFQDWPTINFWHVGFSGFIAPWEKLENIQSIPLLEMWERLNK